MNTVPHHPGRPGGLKTSALEWDRRFMRLAVEVATWSKDPSCKVGCVVVAPDMRRFTLGYNGFPRGVEDSAQRLGDNGMRLALTSHAEVNAVLNARESLEGWTLYCTRPPCLECAKVVVQAGIARVVAPAAKPDSKWADSCHAAACMLGEAGVRLYHHVEVEGLDP